MFDDPILQKLVKRYPAPNFKNRSAFLYEDLLESIVSQQLSIKAADTIFGRVKSLFADTIPQPTMLLQTPDDTLRRAGLSYQKIAYIKSVADAFLRDLIDHRQIKKMTDEEVIAQLTQIKGVGQWTAEMILIFTLNRPDVFSLGDLGLRNAIKNLYGITDKEKMLQLSQTWSPYRSTASWYLWRSLENAKN